MFCLSGDEWLGVPTMTDRFGFRLPIGVGWFDLWHSHVDWHGRGNRDSEFRRSCLEVLFATWSDVELLTRGLTCAWQSWLLIDPADSSQDAIYLHTPNPNRDNFPYPFDGVSWGVESPSWLADFVGPLDVDLGRSEHDGAVLYWVRRAAR